ncbi:MAG: pilus assembly protein PilM [Dehalococcoidales bacterium]|nr:pilus assembly protein PilM [Dehalococcoidales bacterium]
MPVSLIISNHDVKLVSSRGNTLEKWVSAPLPPASVKDGHILQPGTVAGAVNSLFRLLELPRTRIIASISGMSFTYRMLKLPAIKPALMQEAIERAIRKEINVPLDELYIDWQILSKNAKGIEAFAVGVPRSQIDSLVETVHLSSLELSAIDLKPLALVRASEMKDGIIVDFEPDCFNIIILSSSIPVTLHTFNPKNSQASLEDNIHYLSEELARTIDFYNITQKDRQISPDTPVLLTGELSASPAAERLFSQHCSYPVKIMTAGFRTPPDFPVSSFAGNIGLMLKKGPAGINARGSSTYCGQINVDPLTGRKRALSRSWPLRKLALPAAAALALILVVCLTFFRNSAAAETASLQTEMDGITRSIFLRDLALKEAEETQAAIDLLEEETDNLKEELQLMSGKGQLSALLGLVLDSLPEGAVCSTIVSDPQTIILDATAGQRSDVFGCARYLEESGFVSDVRIQSLEDFPADPQNPGGSAGVAFKIIVER